PSASAPAVTAALRGVGKLGLDAEDVPDSAEKGIDYDRVKVRGATLAQDPQALLERERRLVRPPAAQRVEYVRHRGDPAFYRAVGLRQPAGIARAVPFFLVGERNPRCQR